MPSPFGEFFLARRQQVLGIAIGRLETLKALLPEEEILDWKYVAELHSILDLMEHGAALNLERYRLVARNRSVLRINLLALLAVCDYQSRPHQPAFLRSGFGAAPQQQSPPAGPVRASTNPSGNEAGTS
jgi:hypothetical protein